MRNGLIYSFIFVAFASIYLLIGSRDITPISSTVSATKEKPLVVIIASYNNSQWVERNLSSIFQQKYDNYRIIYINDCSSDDTLEKVHTVVKKYKQEHRVSIINNIENKGALYNIHSAILSCKDNEIITTIDGDDWLKENRTDIFSLLNNAYQEDIWMTYGSYEHYPTGSRGICKPLPAWIIEEQAYRTQPWITSHLRTFYAWLYKKIKLEDLKFNNDFFKVTWDQAFMFPMLEMSKSHIRYIDEILYVYNVQNPLNDFKVRLREQLMMERYIRSKTTYKPLEQSVVVA